MPKIKNIIIIFFLPLLLFSCSHYGKDYDDMKSSSLRIVLLGPPGVGKGTNALMLSRRYNVPHISTSDILKESLDSNDFTSIEVKKLMNRGSLVSDDLILNLIAKRLKNHDCLEGFILDGFPRTIGQAKGLSKILQSMSKSPLFIINLSLPDEEIFNRIKKRGVCAKCNQAKINKESYSSPLCSTCSGDEVIRPDDDLEVVENRLKIYHSQSEPVISYYKNQRNFLNINAVTLPQTFSDIVAFIDNGTKVK